MIVEIKVPVLPESVSEGTLGAWHKKVGDPVQQDDLLVELETDKVVLEIVATESGVLKSIDVEEGATVVSNQVIGSIDTEAATQASAGTTQASEESPAAQAAPAAAQPAAVPTEATASADSVVDEGTEAKAGPAARKLMKQHGVDASEVQGSGSRGSRMGGTDSGCAGCAMHSNRSGSSTLARTMLVAHGLGERGRSQQRGGDVARKGAV